MAYREHGMWEVLDVLKRHHRGESQRRIAVVTGRGRKTIRAYIREAKKLGWSKEVPPDDEFASRVAQRRQPGPSSSEASASEKALRAHHDRIQQWVEGPEGERGLKLTKVHELLTREGVDVSYSSVYRYAVEQFGLARSRLTLRRAEVSPGRGHPKRGASSSLSLLQLIRQAVLVGVLPPARILRRRRKAAASWTPLLVLQQQSWPTTLPSSIGISVT